MPSETYDTPESVPLPCPCCSSPAETGQIPFDEDDPNAGGYFVRCTSDDCLIGMGLRFACGDDPRPELIRAWNRRAAPVSEGEAAILEAARERARRKQAFLDAPGNTLEEDVAYEAYADATDALVAAADALSCLEPTP